MAVSNQVEPESKLCAVKEYLEGRTSLNRVAEKYGISRSTLQKWLLNYELFGKDGLTHRTKNQRYSEKTKRLAVAMYLSGHFSINMICKKYQLRSRTQLEKWILLYNGQKEFSSPGGRTKGVHMTMMNRQKRNTAVEYCLEHGKDYQTTAALFGCTYQQIYGWVRAAAQRPCKQSQKGQTDISVAIEENRRLKKANSALELELVVRHQLQMHRLQSLEKVDLSGVRNLPKYQTIQQLNQEQGWPVGQLCKAVGVSRAAYYKWLNRTVSKKQSSDEKLAGLILEIYQAQHGIPGYRQMRVILERRYGIKCDPKRVYRLMRILGLQSICRRKKHRSRKKSSMEYTAENILNRRFSASYPNEKWLTDITELQYGDGRKAYLSAVLDLYGRNIVSFSVSRKNDTALVLKTFDQAFTNSPDSRPLIHSDRGTQYTSHAFRRKLEENCACQSMSRPGKCLDNAPMEGFWGILKSELYYPNHFDEYDQLCHAIDKYIFFYNYERYQKKLGCMTPAEFLATKRK